MLKLTRKRKPVDFMYRKYDFNRYGTVINFVFNILTELTYTNDMCNDLIKFNNEINELKEYHFVRDILDEDNRDMLITIK